MPTILIFRLFFNYLKVYNFSHSSPPKLICYRWSVLAKYINILEARGDNLRASLFLALSKL